MTPTLNKTGLEAKRMRISNYKQIGKGVVVASFNLTLPKMGDFEIRGCTLFDSNGKRWVSMPSRAYEDKETGKQKYFAYCGFASRELNDKFSAQIMKVLDEHIKTLEPQANVAQMDIDDLPF